MLKASADASSSGGFVPREYFKSRLSRARGILSIAYYQCARRAGYAHQWMTGHRCMTAGSTFYYFCGHVSRRAISSPRKWEYDTTPLCRGAHRGRNREEAERKGAISCVGTSGKSSWLSAFRAALFLLLRPFARGRKKYFTYGPSDVAMNVVWGERILPLISRLPSWRRVSRAQKNDALTNE
jgi:hypothetical protein